MSNLPTAVPPPSEPTAPSPITFPGTAPVGSIGGIPLYVHVLAPLVLGAVLIFARAVGGNSLATIFLVGAISLLLHEVGHALMARRAGCTVQGVVVYPLRNLLVLREKTLTPRQEMRIAWGGPLVNLVLVACFWSYLAFSGNATVRPDHFHSIAGGETVAFLMFVNAAMLMGNLVPALPFDGGTFFRAFLTQTIGRREATHRVAQTGFWFAVAFGLIGIAMKAPLVAFFGFMIFTSTVREARQENNLAALDGALVREAMRSDFRTLSVVDRVHHAAKRCAESKTWFFLVMQGDQVVGTLDYATIQRFLAKKQGDAYVREAMQESFVSVRPDDALESAMIRLTQNRNRPLLVQNDETVVGILTEEGIGNFLKRSAAYRS